MANVAFTTAAAKKHISRNFIFQLHLHLHHSLRASSSFASSSVQFRRMFDSTQYSNYEEFYANFKWHIPDKFNIGYECSDYHVANGDGDKIALIDHTSQASYSFDDISRLSNKLCNALQHRLGVNDGDRVSILLPQSYETGISHVSAFKLGAISLPLFILFGDDALEYRLSDSASKVVITNEQCLPTILSIRHNLPHLEHIIVTGKHVQDCADYHSFESLISNGDAHFAYKQTSSEDPAVIIYTSGTTGNPKGCLHAHRVLLGHLPGIETPHNFLPQPNDVFWTPADWAWIGGLFDALLPAWYYGIPIVAYRPQKFDVVEAFELMQRYQVTSTFLPPTALKMMKMVCEQQVDLDTNCELKHKLRSIGSGGESLGDALHEWAVHTFDTEINEFYGQTECNLIVSNAVNIFEPKPRSMGKPVPGHIVEIMDNDGNLCKADEVGNIVVKSPDPVMFLNYWNNPEKTKEKFLTHRQDGSQWLVTGDLGKKTVDGYFYYDSRDDDVISSRGYRVGPGPIEVACMRHQHVLNCAVIGVPDDNTGEKIKAFIVLKDGCSASNEEIVHEIKELVREHQGHFVVPKEVEFIDQLPMTITGKVQRKVLKQLEFDRYQQAKQSKHNR